MTDLFEGLFLIFLPFFGTALGATFVFCSRNIPSPPLQKIFFGLAAGVMQAALIWSLLLPSLEQSKTPVPTVSGLILGILLFLTGDFFLSRRKKNSDRHKTSLLICSVTLHNIPEGMAVGTALATASGNLSAMAVAIALTVGIALQNVPEGAIISLPLQGLGEKKSRAFFWGVLSGTVEPVFAILSFFLTKAFQSSLPFVLSFAAGSMMYATVSELIPATVGGTGEKRGILAYGLGFAIMMVLDVLLSP